MNIETRDDGKYIITGKKHKMKDIVIKLKSILDCETVFFYGDNTKTANLIWQLIEKDGSLYIEVSSDYDEEINMTSHLKKIDTDECIEELVQMIKSNKTLESCKTIKETMYKCYNEYFLSCYEKTKNVILSNIIVEGLVSITSGNKILGYGTRFILNKNELTVCEYSGKTILRDDNSIRIDIKLNNIDIVYIIQKNMFNSKREVFDQSEDTLGYLKYKGYMILMKDENKQQDDNKIQYPKIKAPLAFSDPISMQNYCIENNEPELLTKYKIALKGKVELLDINKYMLREFSI